jgi:hypothetical protein
MTRAQIIEGLEVIALRLAKAEAETPAGFAAHEWAYVKGLAAGAIMRVRDDLARVASS